MDMIQFLQKIATGTAFKSPGTSMDDLVAFQPIVYTALRAEKLGYIEGVVAHKEAYTGCRFYSALSVRRITIAGRQALIRM
jgi:hypothetical protein